MAAPGPAQQPSQPPTTTLTDDQLTCASLVKKIKEHYVAIEELRLEDRNKWREMNKRLEKLEHEKSKKGRKVRNKKKSDLKNESKNVEQKSNENKVVEVKAAEPSPKKDDKENEQQPVPDEKKDEKTG